MSRTKGGNAGKSQKSPTPSGNPEALARGRAERIRIQGKINCRTLERRRRRLHEIPTKAVAIRNFCRECLGFDSGGEGSLQAAIAKCPAYECWLYPWRNGKLDEEA